jgi:hypothetical protein
MDIQPDSFVGAVPASFLGISREWTQAVYWDRNLAAFGNIFDVLGPAPVIRIGGASQEALVQVGAAAAEQAGWLCTQTGGRSKFKHCR